MANLKTIQVPVEVKMQIANQTQAMRSLYKDFQDIFASVDPGSTFGKSIAKAFSKIENKLSASEGLLSNEFFSEADLQKVASQLSNISELFGQINIQARGVSANTLGLDTTEIENAEKHLKQLLDRVRELKGAKVGTLLGADSKDLQEFAKLSKTTGFSGGKSYTENYKSMEAAIGRVTEKYGQLTIEAQGAEEALRQANEEAAKAHVRLNMTEGQLANRKQVNLNVANQIMGVKVRGKGATRDSITEQYLSMLDSQLDQGQWVAGGENFAHIIAGWLEVDEADLAGTATDIVNNLKNAIRTAMAGGPIASNKLRVNAKSVLGEEEAALRKDAGYTELEQKVQTSTTQVQSAETAAAEALSTLQAANNNVEQTRQLLEEIQTQMARLKKLQDEYNAAVDAQHREQIDAARQGVRTANSNTKAETLNASEKASKAVGYTAQETQEIFARNQARRQAEEAEAKAKAIAAKESQEFTANLKQSISHWMSAQQVINMVKDGLRQAYNDIKNLDSAMTNIAVVTDMSISDLWGKINDYMAIAQQYGVTTQGVYEVSQLYYQQGLSTSEVMAATTETLKMARIAGMDYAEATDAMTVAIRAFKMEMSDAGHITDVYSKVAAVTASDTEELAIAMSKTASSAESVGSSFENTTAMLAVMIETTRESAQNLGSALKSIISRYGEMKVGLTVDSEGEEIDYNKVDTALKSVGISIKDVQGQFRDFDDVIFELSEKWDGLDKNTQRYIATIMAGNRQQSRFIALVDNWERLDEVTKAAANSQDAGLLQYSKTLDSLETKLTNIKTSFQQFYMSIINGPVVGFFLELGNSILQVFNKLGAIQSIFNVLTWVRTIKMIANLIFKGFEGPMAKIVTSYKQHLQEMTRLSGSEAFKAGQTYAQQFDNGMNSRPNGRVARRMQNGGYNTPADQQQNAFFGWRKHQTMGQAISIGGQLVGTLLSSISTATANSNAAVSTWTGIGGNVASTASMGAVLGPWGAAVGGLLGAVTSLHEAADIEAKQAQIDYENAQKAADDANIKRAETKNNSDTLKSLIDQYKVADKNKNDSQENYDNWLSINQQLADMYPALISYMDEEGNAIVNITEASLLLEDAFKKTTSATLDYYNKEILKRRAENASYGATGYAGASTWGGLAAMFAGDDAVVDGLNVINEALERETLSWESFWSGMKGYVFAQDKASVADFYNIFGDLKEYVRYLQGIDSPNQYTKGDVTYIRGGAGSGYDYGAENVAQGLLKIGIIEYDKASGAYSLSNAAQEYDPNFENSVELRGLLKARSLQHLSNLSNESFMDDSLSDIEGFNGFYYYYLKTIKDLSDDQIALLTDISYNDYLSPISEFYNQLNITNKNLFNGLISNINNYSFSALKSLLQTLGAPEEIATTFEQQWQQSNNQWQILLARQYAQQAGRDPNLIFHWNDFKSFSKDFDYGRMNGHGFADSANGDVWTAWLNYLAQYAPDNQKYIFDNLNATEAQKYLSWYSNTSDLDNSIGVEKDVTRTRRNWIIERYNETFDLKSAFARLDEAQRAEFRDLLLTDDGSAEWANKIEQYAQQYGIDITDLASIERYVFENLNTRTAQFTDSVSSYTEKIKKLTDKQKDGYTMSEAQALAELREMPLLELFEVNESGLLVLRDLRAEQARVLQEELEKGRNLKEKYRLTRDHLLNADAAGYSQRSIIEQAINAETEEETMSLLSASIEDLIGPDAIESLGIDGELAKQLTMEIRNGTIKTYDDFTAYLEKQLELLEITEDQYNKITAELQNEQDRIKFGEKYQADISATGLDKLFGGTLIDAEGVFTADWGSVDAAGNLLINDYAALLDALAEVLGEDSEAFRTWRKAIIAESVDVEKDVNKSLVDVISKMQLAQMYGLQRVQLTNEEVKALYESYVTGVETPDDFDTWADYHRFSQTGTGYEFNTAYATGEWNANGYTWDKFFYTEDGWLGIGGALDTATTTALYEAKADLIKIIEGLNLDSDYSSVKKFFDVGILTEEQYQAFFTSGQTAYEYLMSILSQSANAEVQAAVKKAKDAVILKEALELDSSRLNLEDNFINLFQNISETSLQDIQRIYEQIYGKESFTPEIVARYQIALDQAREGTVQPLIDLLYELANMANLSDKGFEVDTAKFNSAYKDANNSLISGLAQSLSSGISGTLSNVDFDNLIEQIGDPSKNYRKYVTETYNGLKLSTEGLLELASQLVKKVGDASLVAKTLVTQFDGKGMLGSYKEIDDLIKEIESTNSEFRAENQTILLLLKQMRAEYSQLASEATFDFMNQDHFEGSADNWYSFTESVRTAIETLSAAFNDGAKIDYRSFDNLFQWFDRALPDGLETKIEGTGKSLNEFVAAVMETIDATGQVDLSQAAANFGVGLKDMSSALDTGLKEIAQQQVDYWTKYLDFLKGIKKLQQTDELIIPALKTKGSIENGGWTFGDDTYETPKEAWEAVYKWFEEFNAGTEEEPKYAFSDDANPIKKLIALHPEIGIIDDTTGKVIFNSDEEANSSFDLFNLLMPQVAKMIEGDFSAEDITNFIALETLTIKFPFTVSVEPEKEESQNNLKQDDLFNKDDSLSGIYDWLIKQGAEDLGNNVYRVNTQDGLVIQVAVTNGSLDFDFTLGEIQPDANAALEILKAAKYIDSNGHISIKTSDFQATFIPSSGTLTGSWVNVKGNPDYEAILTKLGFSSSTSSNGTTTYSLTSDGSTWNFTVVPGKNSSTLNFDASNLTPAGKIYAEYFFSALGITSQTNESGTAMGYTIPSEKAESFVINLNGNGSVDIAGITTTNASNDLLSKLKADGLSDWTYDETTQRFKLSTTSADFVFEADGSISVIPKVTDPNSVPTIGSILKEAFPEGSSITYEGNETDGYTVKTAEGKVLFKIPPNVGWGPMTYQPPAIDLTKFTGNGWQYNNNTKQLEYFINGTALFSLSANGTITPYGEPDTSQLTIGQLLGLLFSDTSKYKVEGTESTGYIVTALDTNTVAFRVSPNIGFTSSGDPEPETIPGAEANIDVSAGTVNMEEGESKTSTVKDDIITQILEWNGAKYDPATDVYTFSQSDLTCQLDLNNSTATVNFSGTQTPENYDAAAQLFNDLYGAGVTTFEFNAGGETFTLNCAGGKAAIDFTNLNTPESQAIAADLLVAILGNKQGGGLLGSLFGRGTFTVQTSEKEQFEVQVLDSEAKAVFTNVDTPKDYDAAAALFEALYAKGVKKFTYNADNETFEINCENPTTSIDFTNLNTPESKEIASKLLVQMLGRRQGGFFGLGGAFTVKTSEKQNFEVDVSDSEAKAVFTNVDAPEDYDAAAALFEALYNNNKGVYKFTYNANDEKFELTCDGSTTDVDFTNLTKPENQEIASKLLVEILGRKQGGLFGFGGAFTVQTSEKQEFEVEVLDGEAETKFTNVDAPKDYNVAAALFDALYNKGVKKFTYDANGEKFELICDDSTTSIDFTNLTQPGSQEIANELLIAMLGRRQGGFFGLGGAYTVKTSKNEQFKVTVTDGTVNADLSKVTTQAGFDAAVELLQKLFGTTTTNEFKISTSSKKSFTVAPDSNSTAAVNFDGLTSPEDFTLALELLEKVCGYETDGKFSLSTGSETYTFTVAPSGKILVQTGNITAEFTQEDFANLLASKVFASETSDAETEVAQEAAEVVQTEAEALNDAVGEAVGEATDNTYNYEIEGYNFVIKLGKESNIKFDLGEEVPLDKEDLNKKLFEYFRNQGQGDSTGEQTTTGQDSNNWVYKHEGFGLTIKCTNGKLEFDYAGFIPPDPPSEAEIGKILNKNAEEATDAAEAGASNAEQKWKSEGGVFSTTLSGISFVYKGESGKIIIDNPTVVPPDIAALLETFKWTAETDEDGIETGVYYYNDASGLTFKYDTTTENLTIDATTIVDNNTDVQSRLMSLGWFSSDGIIYSYSSGNLTFQYNTETEKLTILPPEVKSPSDADIAARLENEGYTKVGRTFFKISSGKVKYIALGSDILLGEPTGVNDDAFVNYLKNTKHWEPLTDEKGSIIAYTSHLGTIAYDATVNALTITPAADIDTNSTSDLTALFNDAFGEDGWSTTADGTGYEVYGAQGEVLFTIPAELDLTPKEGADYTLNGDTIEVDGKVTFEPELTQVTNQLKDLEKTPLNLSLQLNPVSGGPLIQTPAFSQMLLAQELLQDTIDYDHGGTYSSGRYEHKEAMKNYIAAVKTYAIMVELAVDQLSEEDLKLAQDNLTKAQEFLAEISSDPQLTQFSSVVNAQNKIKERSDELKLNPTAFQSPIITLLQDLSSQQLLANLSLLSDIITTLSTPVEQGPDISPFLEQLKKLSELTLDDEELTAFAEAATSVNDILTILDTAGYEITIGTETALQRLQTLLGYLNTLESKGVKVTLEMIHGSGGKDTRTQPTMAVQYAGNVSGLAYAKGNATTKLLEGAALANKTLVGELGPELAIYNNRYHLLGANGAEFVNLPDDAIVFNHKQTEGIARGQSGYRGKALVNGNVSGAAAADGIDSAIATVEKIIGIWSGIANSTVADLLAGSSSNGGGGGGSGNTLKAVTEELQEWYNLTRQIANLEQEINNVVAERANILERDGAAYLRSLREQQRLLQDQTASQEILLGYQKLQLQRQADLINQNAIWSQFLTINENGLLQYRYGNETNGGKGALNVLASLNEMSGEQQLAYLNELGYSYTTPDGERLEGEELISQFFQELQDQIDSYDALYDTVHETEGKLEELTTSIREIDQEIKENRMALEQDIFDILVEAWEAEIEALTEQKDLVEEANKAYIDNLNEALKMERDMYSQEEQIANREQLQRQLSLLRRSGGSASQIADLENQLNDMLKEEYFNKQEQMIKDIQDANDEQIRLLDEQIRLQEEALEYQQENGVLWSQVYEILGGSTEEILAFMQGNSVDFFAQSTLQQEQMLTEWAKKIGIVKEDQKYQEFESQAQSNAWNSEAIWEQEGMSGFKSVFEGLNSATQEAIRSQFNRTYSNARLAGDDHETAFKKATDAIRSTLRYQQTSSNSNKQPSTEQTSDMMQVVGPGRLNLREQPTQQSTSLGQYEPGTQVKVLEKTNSSWYKVEVGGKTGYMSTQYLTGSTGENNDSANSAGEKYIATYTVKFADGSSASGSGVGNTPDEARLNAQYWANQKKDAKGNSGVDIIINKPKAFAEGGIVDYTGIALVHGSPTKPEAFLNAKQTAMISEALRATGDSGILNNIKNTLAAFNSTLKGIADNNFNQASSITIAPGAVTIQVAELNDAYDVEELSKDVMNRMVAIAAKATSRGVNRR